MHHFRRCQHASAVPPRRRAARRVLPTVSAPPRPPPLPPTTPEDSFNGPLYSLKAFAVATAIVISTAAISVTAVMACLDVRDTTEFAARMRAWVSQSMPLLNARIYRSPTTRDSANDSPVRLAAAASAPQAEPALDHDTTEQRLADAFDKGGFEAWTEAVAREMETEMERREKN